MTTAERIAELLGGDGQNFTSRSGRTLEDLCDERGARTAKARVRYNDETGEDEVEAVSRSEDIFDRIRYTFADGSAIVIAGDAWDIEGPTPFSWAGA